MRKDKPHIIITSADAERLDRLLDSMSNRAFPGMEELEEELARAEIVAPEHIPPHVVTMNSTVLFETLPAGKEFRLTLVYPGGTATAEDCISILAPVGGALLGLSVGDEIAWPLPGGGEVRVHIKNVIFQPERAGEFF